MYFRYIHGNGILASTIVIYLFARMMICILKRIDGITFNDTAPIVLITKWASENAKTEGKRNA